MVSALAGEEKWRGLRALVADMSGPDGPEARAELTDELLDLLPTDHPVIRILRTRAMFVRPDAATWRAEALPQTSTMPVTIYLSDERIHEDVEAAVEELLATAGLRICDREDPVTGSWFRRMAPTVKAAVNSPLSREALATAAHAADARLVLAQDAVVTATLMQNLAPVLGALHPTKDAVIRAGALLVVKMNWTVSVIQLTAAQQLHLDHHPELVRCPAEIAAALNLIASDCLGDGPPGTLGPPPHGA